MRGLGRIQVIAVAGMILLARSVVADDWPYYQHDAWHTGDSSALVIGQRTRFLDRFRRAQGLARLILERTVARQNWIADKLAMLSATNVS
jgi:hypothetical protein